MFIIPCLSVLGSLGVGQLSLQATSFINHEDHFSLMASDIMMRYASKISANKITIDAGSVHQEGEATLLVTARGREESKGMGDITADGSGLGAGHGGYGGGADKLNHTKSL